MVITIIAILISSLLPAIKKAKEHARRVHCMSGVRQILIPLNQYILDNKDFYPWGRWGTPTIMGGGKSMMVYMNVDLSTFGSNYADLSKATNVTKIMACPSWDGSPTNPSDGVYYRNTLDGPESTSIHSTYIYMGGNGKGPVDPNNPYHGDMGAGNGWTWHRWSCGPTGAGSSGDVLWHIYDDPNQLGPVWNVASRNRTNTTAILTDRMWLPGQTGAGGGGANINTALNENWCDYDGVHRLNHARGVDGETDGGSVGMLDGHVEFRNRDLVEANRAALGRDPVRAYGAYQPYIVY